MSIKIPNDFNYIEVYYTLKCNLGCDYCINKSSGIIRTRNELDSIAFSNALNRMDFQNRPVTIGGGEPTSRDDFYEFVNNMRPDIKIDLLTNLSFDVDTFLKNMNPNRFFNTVSKNLSYKSIRVSYHPKYMNREEVISKAKILQDNGYSIGFFGINHPLNTEYNIEMAEIARMNKIYFFIKDFLGSYDNKIFGYFHHPEGIDGIHKSCLCRSNELLISPDGSIYKCHRDLYNNEFSLSNIIDEDLKIEFRYRECQKFGSCNPCDLKIKTNRYLQMGHQTTDIIFNH